jgi:hypothetical protein
LIIFFLFREDYEDEENMYSKIDLEGLDLEGETDSDQSHRWDRPPPRRIDSRTESLGEFVFREYSDLL